MLSIEERSRYQSDLGDSWLRLPVLFAGPLLAAGVSACFLTFVYTVGWYLMLLWALGFGFLLGGVLFVLVDWTHCRNCWLAGGVGITAGLFAYLGYYHLCLVDLLPPGNAWRGDLLPKYVWWRLQSDAVEDLGIGNDLSRVNPQGKQPTRFSNYWFFVFELLIIAGVPAAFAWKRAQRAYCVELGQWMQKEKALLAPYSFADFRTDLDEGTLPQFVAKNPAGHAPQTPSRLILEYLVPKTRSPLKFPVYISLEDFPLPRPWYLPGMARRTLVRQVELEPAEVMSLRPLFPKLKRLLKAKHSEVITI